MWLWYDFSTILIRFWYDFDTIRFWYDFDSILLRFWYDFDTILERFWHKLGTILVPILVWFWYDLDTILLILIRPWHEFDTILIFAAIFRVNYRDFRWDQYREFHGELTAIKCRAHAMWNSTRSTRALCRIILIKSSWNHAENLRRLNTSRVHSP